MAFKLLLIVSLVTVAHARYGWIDDDNDDSPPGYQRLYVPPLMQPPPLPAGFPQPPPLMAPPPLYAPVFGHRFTVPQPVVPVFQMSFPTTDDIKDVKPGPGQVFSGISVRSSSGFTKDEDGNVVKTGGTSMVLNDNGDVTEAKVGDNPPNIDDPVVIPSFPFRVHQVPKFKPFVFEPITFKPFVFEPITFKPVDINYVPKEGETFTAVHTSSHSESSDINGVKQSSGGTNLAVNENGQVEQEGVEFHQGDDGTSFTETKK